MTTALQDPPVVDGIESTDVFLQTLTEQLESKGAESDEVGKLRELARSKGVEWEDLAETAIELHEAFREQRLPQLSHVDEVAVDPPETHTEPRETSNRFWPAVLSGSMLMVVALFVIVLGQLSRHDPESTRETLAAVKAEMAKKTALKSGLERVADRDKQIEEINRKLDLLRKTSDKQPSGRLFQVRSSYSGGPMTVTVIEDAPLDIQSREQLAKSLEMIAARLRNPGTSTADVQKLLMQSYLALVQELNRNARRSAKPVRIEPGSLAIGPKRPDAPASGSPVPLKN